jgi:hypothetical protein
MTPQYWYCEDCDQVYRPLWADDRSLPRAPRDLRCSDCGKKLTPYQYPKYEGAKP